MGYSVTVPVAGSSLPITSRHSDEYQTERSGAMPSAYGLVLALGNAYSLNVGLGIEALDLAALVDAEPDHAVVVDLDAARTVARGRDIFRHLQRLRVDLAERARPRHLGEPDRALLVQRD